MALKWRKKHHVVFKSKLYTFRIIFGVDSKVEPELFNFFLLSLFYQLNR